MSATRWVEGNRESKGGTVLFLANIRAEAGRNHRQKPLTRLREALRSRHFSHRTGQTYRSRVRRIIVSHRLSHPEEGYDIRTVQELLDHKDVRTTMVYPRSESWSPRCREPCGQIRKLGGIREGWVHVTATVGIQRCSMKRLMSIVIVVFAAAAAAVTGEKPSPVQAAQALFERYVTLEQQFDPLVADLYSDDAVIKNKRTYPTGQVREMTLPASQYKDLIRKAMPVAKLRGDTSSYSDCTFSEEGARVRINCKRFSNLKKYTSPISLLVGPTAQGWLIFEELSESQP